MSYNCPINNSTISSLRQSPEGKYSPVMRLSGKSLLRHRVPELPARTTRGLTTQSNWSWSCALQARIRRGTSIGSFPHSLTLYNALLLLLTLVWSIPAGSDSQIDHTLVRRLALCEINAFREPATSFAFRNQFIPRGPSQSEAAECQCRGRVHLLRWSKMWMRNTERESNVVYLKRAPFSNKVYSSPCQVCYLLHCILNV